MEPNISEGSVLDRLSACVQFGKLNADANIPPGSKGQPGVVELVQQALDEGLEPQNILDGGLLAGMQIIGKQFAANEVFVPEVLVSARAMQGGVGVLRPHFAETEATSRGTFVIGTVRGDLHDIGKNLVSVILEGAGWKVVDLGTDCAPEKFVEAIEQHQGCVVGLSALLTTTMQAMRETVAAIREKNAETVILVGGAPVTEAFAKEIGATGYAAEPNQAVAMLDELAGAA